MKVLHGWLQGYFEKPIPRAEELADLFTFHSFEVEGIEGADTDNPVIDAKVLPDRAHYALCHAGIALEVSALTGQPLRSNRIPPGPAATLTQKVDVRIDAPQFCRRYMARYGEIGQVAPSNPHAKSMLEAIGQRAINAVVDATNITMFDCGQPLHIFDADTVKGTIVVRAAKNGEKIMLLDSSAGEGREVELLETDHVIADDTGPIAIAGVKGGKKTGVTATTRRIIVESANFAPEAVRRTATRLNLRSESSKRYENEITPELTAEGMNSVCGLVLHNIKDATFGPIVDVYPQPAVKRTIEFNPVSIENRLGTKVPLAEARQILERLMIGVEDKGKLWKLTIPFNRFDLTFAEDIVEEVGRIYGYEHVKGILPPPIAGGVPVLPEYYLSEKLKNALVAQGFSEVSLYTLVAKGDIETAYPLARDKAFARKNLTDGLMACLEKNILNADLLGLDTVKVFELGRVFDKNGERLMLAIGISKGKIDEVVKSLDLGIAAPKPIAKGKLSVIEIDLSAVLKTYQLPAGASYSDLGFTRASQNKYKKFSLLPFMVRDIAVFVPESVTAEQVWAEIEKGVGAEKPLLVRHALFDTYKKDGKTSYAYRLVFQAEDRTLTDDEATKIMEAVYSAMKAKGWEVR